jgi:hypothetical protein
MPTHARHASAGLLALVAGALVLCATDVAARLWMDEAIAVGIASHSLTEIPGLLRLDGSPPLYYVLLHLWMAVAGDSEAAVHWLSVVFAVAAVPVAWWAGSVAFGRRTGWVLAALTACNPFLVSYAQEARMYSLVILLALAAVGLFAGAFVHGRRRWTLPFGVVLALLLYAHNWALFLGAGFAVALVIVAAAAPARRALVLRDGAVGFGLAALLYLPWVPSLLFQARHTGAPWATSPTGQSLLEAPTTVLGAGPALVAAFVAAAAVARAGAVAGARRGSLPVHAPRRASAAAGAIAASAGRRDVRVLVAALAAVAVVPVALGWGLSQLTPAWDPRYLAVVVAPVLALLAAALARAGRPGLGVLGLIVVLSVPAAGTVGASNAYQLGRAAQPWVRHGDLVVCAPMGQLPLLARYLPDGLRYATPLGLAPDPRVVDWRDAAQRVARSTTRRDLVPLLDRVPLGAGVVYVVPGRWDARSGQTVLGRAQRRRAELDLRWLLRDPRFALVAVVPGDLGGRAGSAALRALVFRRVASRDRAPAAAGEGGSAARRARSGPR